MEPLAFKTMEAQDHREALQARGDPFRMGQIVGRGHQNMVSNYLTTTSTATPASYISASTINH